jgi:NAD(P)-dependent dehydrogenase (short-subunit alcohol dehydrogenase family)
MQSVLITGASTGVGRAAALRMDGEGWKVFAGVRSEQDEEMLRRSSSGRLVPLRLDITSPEQIAGAVDRVSATVGTRGLDGLVNNAGITIPSPLEAIPLDDFRRLITVNLTGQLATTQALLPNCGCRGAESSSSARSAAAGERPCLPPTAHRKPG